MSEFKGIRINKFLANSGIGSRRKCEEFIKSGLVTINGKVVSNLSTRVNPKDHVKFNNKLINTKPPISVVLNKPILYLCTKKDLENRKIIYDLLPNKFLSLNYAGRLDYNSKGLILLSNSGEIIEKFTHPKHRIEKEYIVKINKPLNIKDKAKLLQGVKLSEGLAVMEDIIHKSKKQLHVILKQGYNRQIRRMFESINYQVESLERIRLGNLYLNSLSTGSYKIISQKEIKLILGN